MKKQKMEIVGLIILVLGLSTYVIFRYNSYSTKEVSSPPTSGVNQGAETYNAEGLEISITVEKPVLMDDRPNFLTLTYRDQKIILNRIASDFDTLDEYLTDLFTKNNVTEHSREVVSIDGEQGYKIKSSIRITEEPIYYVEHEGWVYSFYATSNELSDTVESIQKSLKFK